ncbi:penicillin-binding protein 1A [Paraburkholderia caballeronis]|uniref:Penicillin-binding protein 1A n=1 Tax=Paraburkholderia caballeronis TaxID=416943 RepID=A0A1H7IXX0_9BURK|nr:penicillin-binding protein 1A [Paraburkholderia caballeronis]PXW27645.1 penicillin-binding protein 1A [Paraburkholderia caballeronis]PXX03119.1 penicillin-binding protein 1A [Paraburkholderia caballeronis]RAK03844.1 penicillin-binding protein 1A [Paraburkholderia caballeronis]TDV20977.1 penicillin-binding protein 1A [Paraburkholderia caballeronis]TDV21406.1 penicillin-binding protein 1A [Paraburkholderia caballeronis]
MPIIKRPPSPQYPNDDREPSFHHGNGSEPPRHTTSRDGVARRRSLGASIALGFFGLIATLVVVGALIAGYALVVMGPQLPSLDALTDYRPKVPLRVYTADHVLIGEFGEERRQLVRFQDIPDVMKKAVLAIEDYRFYEHGGVDFVGILRAGFADLSHGGASQGASTITMQVARNFFLSSEKTYTRKIYEMLLAYKIERALTKDQILELYMNQIYLGQRAYGFSAAARVYFGKDLKDITLAEAAMLAGLPKAPSAYNPVVNPRRAKIRQEYILKRMLDLRYITQAQYDEALKQPIVTRGAGNEYSVHAEYVAEMVRQMMYAQYRDETYTRGLTVTTTIDSGDQDAAYRAVRKGVMDYERRHGYRGPEGFVALPADSDDREQAIDDALSDHPDNGEIVAAVVTSAAPKEVKAQLLDGTAITVNGDGLRFVAAALSPRASQTLAIRAGSIVRVVADDKGNWQITQLPQVEGALVSLTPQDGAIRALIGGFDFNKNKFNHITQAWRQPGSSFKPFIYSAALEKGLGPATIINDAPLYFPPTTPGGDAWEPKDDDQPDGPMPMRLALQKSKNLVSIRILSFIGTKYAQDYVTQRFGFDADKTPPYLPMALGAGLVTPLQSAGAYSVFANGGYRINPYLIAEVDDAHGQPLLKAQPLVAGQNAPQTLTPRNAFVMNSLLHSVATAGTGAGTNVLRRSDLQGKTGTTNDAKDGWFAGYQRTLVAVAWMGYDQPKSLGSREFGAQLALPIWVEYMQRALRGVPQEEPPTPDGVTTVDGELFFADKTPGNGFVASIGLDAANPAGGATDMVGGVGPAGMTPPPPPPPDVSSNEKKQIMDLFETNKP